MLIALLALLGVDLIALVFLVAIVLTRKRWVKRQSGAFRGAVRSPAEKSMACARSGIAVTGAGFAMSSFGRRRRSYSETSWWPPTAWRRNVLPSPVR